MVVLRSPDRCWAAPPEPVVIVVVVVVVGSMPRLDRVRCYLDGATFSVRSTDEVREDIPGQWRPSTT